MTARHRPVTLGPPRLLHPGIGLPRAGLRPYGVKVAGGRVETFGVSPTPDETYDATVMAAVPVSRPASALLFAVFAGLHLVMLDGTPRLVMAAPPRRVRRRCSALRLRRPRHPLPQHLAQPATPGWCSSRRPTPCCTSCSPTSPGRRPTSCSSSSARALSCSRCAGWPPRSTCIWGRGGSAPSWSGPAAQWPHYVVGMCGATLLSLVVNHLRRCERPRARASRAAAEAAAVRDHLTGLANRRGLAMVGGQMVEQARRQGDAVHCIFVDIDGLKRVNDALGHAVGDEVIVAVAEALRAATRATDVVARWGGDEFCVVGPGPGMAPLELERRVRDGVVLAAEVPVGGLAGPGQRGRRDARARGTPAPSRRCSARPTRRCTCAARCERGRQPAAAAAPPAADSPSARTADRTAAPEPASGPSADRRPLWWSGADDPTAPYRAALTKHHRQRGGPSCARGFFVSGAGQTTRDRAQTKGAR